MDRSSATQVERRGGGNKIQETNFFITIRYNRKIFARKDCIVYGVLKIVRPLVGIRTSNISSPAAAGSGVQQQPAVLQCCTQRRVWCEYFETQPLLQPHSQTRGYASLVSEESILPKPWFEMVMDKMAELEFFATMSRENKSLFASLSTATFPTDPPER